MKRAINLIQTAGCFKPFKVKNKENAALNKDYDNNYNNNDNDDR